MRLFTIHPRIFPTITRFSYKVLLSIFFISFSFSASSQTIFYTENFEGNPCTSGCDPSFIGWTSTNTGANSAFANVWYVSCAENGQAATVCGAGCGTDESLHIGSTTLGDIGAAYDASQTTNKRVESPVISCAGYSTITLAFNYITFAEAGVDYCSLLYYDGTAWSTLTNMAQTTCCGGACNGGRQARWTAFSTVLPASADNNPNVRIGFNWTNNNASGSDPSFAVDDMTLSYTTLLPIELVSFTATRMDSDKAKLNWITQSETNNDFFTIEKSKDGINFIPVLIKDGSGTSNQPVSYVDYDTKVDDEHLFYRLKQTDFNGDFSYSNIVHLEDGGYSVDEMMIYPNPASDEFSILLTEDFRNLDFRLVDIQGRIIQESSFTKASNIHLDLSAIPEGVYFILLDADGIPMSGKLIVAR